MLLNMLETQCSLRCGIDEDGCATFRQTADGPFHLHGPYSMHKISLKVRPGSSKILYHEKLIFLCIYLSLEVRYFYFLNFTFYFFK